MNITSTSGRTAHHAMQILRALLLGLKVRKGDFEYRMDILYRLCQVRTSESGEEVLLVVDFGDGIFLSAFVTWCADFTEDEMAIVGINIVLNSTRAK